MSARRRTKLWIAGVVGVAAVAGVAAVVTQGLPGRRGPEANKVDAIDLTTPLSSLIKPLRESDGRALAVLFQLTTPKADAPAVALGDADVEQWAALLEATRVGYAKYGSYGRASAVTVASRVLQRLIPEPAPATWTALLTPAHDLIASGLEDEGLDVRVTALMEISNLWGWVPGRALARPEEDVLAEWKQGFVAPVQRRLGDKEPKTRVAAIACLGRLPIDASAAVAVSYLDDTRSPEVRNQVLVAFAARPSLLSNEAVLRHMFDQDPVIRESSATVLKIRGLNQEQISLGSMIFHPKPELRASVIPLLKDRTDIDPIVWLLQLSRDPEDSVRVGAADALGARLSVEGGQRLAEMAATDRSPEVRKTAGKYLSEVQKTVSLPPLPGSPSLNPKAN